mgnify:CR=1 FL=1
MWLKPIFELEVHIETFCRTLLALSKLVHMNSFRYFANNTNLETQFLSQERKAKTR